MLVHTECLTPVLWQLSVERIGSIGTFCDVCGYELLDEDEMMDADLEALVNIQNSRN